MRHFKNLNASIATLKAVLATGSVEPEQRKHVERAIECIKQLRRKAHPSNDEVHRCVREIAEHLANAFMQN